MMLNKNNLILYGFCVGALALGGATLVQAQSDAAADTVAVDPAPPMTFAWQPGSGPPPEKYEVEIRKGGMYSKDITYRETATTEITFDVDWLTPYDVRVRGVDAEGRRGPWSKWSVVHHRQK